MNKNILKIIIKKHLKRLLLLILCGIVCVEKAFYVIVTKKAGLSYE